MGLSTPESKVNTASGLSGYPTRADAEYAIKNGFGHGTGLEPYINAEVARVYKNVERGGLDKVLEGETTNERLDTLNNLGLREKIGTIYTQAALAANRSPVASLGFDPSHINLQTKMGNANLGGFYSPDRDKIWANVTPGNESSVVHESIHRGLEILRTKSDEARKILDGMNEETVVRYMMYKTMGDPEGKQGEIDAKQNAQGKALAKTEAAKDIERLEELAADAFAKKRPGGPR